MIESPLVSIIIPVYNAERLVSLTLDSLLNQTFHQFEVIVINDGSRDESSEILDDYAANDSRFRVFHNKNQGQCAASNFGIKQAKGKYIKFLDADDLLNPEHLEIMMERMNNDEDVLVSCEWGRFFDGNPLSAKFTPETVWKDMLPMDWVVASLSQKSDMMPAWLWLIPKKLLDSAGYWDESLSVNNDFDFSIRLISKSQMIRFGKGAKVYYRSGQVGNLSSGTSRRAYESVLKSTEGGMNALLACEDSARIRSVLADRFQYWAYQIYPDFRDLYDYSVRKVEEFGGSNIEYPAGPKYRMLIKLLGWKLAKHVYRLIA